MLDQSRGVAHHVYKQPGHGPTIEYGARADVPWNIVSDLDDEGQGLRYVVCLGLASPHPPIFFVATMSWLFTEMDLGREQDIKVSRKRDQEHEDRQEERANRRVQAKAVGSQDDDKGVRSGSPWSFETAMLINLLL